MLVNTIEKVLAISNFDEVCVSTEDEEIARIARQNKASVPFLRPAELSRDPSTIIDVMLHALDFYRCKGESFSKICVVLATTPFVEINDIVKANNIFDENFESALMSVSATEFPPFNAWVEAEVNGQKFLEPCFPDSPYKYTKSTECPITYRSNGAILIVRSDALLKNKTYRNSRILSYVMPIENSLDIDTRLDYEYAQFLVNTGFFKI